MTNLEEKNDSSDKTLNDNKNISYAKYTIF